MFRAAVPPADVVWTYSGVRPLYDDGASEAKAASRDYVLELDDEPGGAPLLSIIGGKITTYRRWPRPCSSGWRRTCPRARARGRLDGHDAAARWRVRPRELPALTSGWRAAIRSWSRPRRRLVRTPTARAPRMLRQGAIGGRSRPRFGATLTEAEVRYLIEQEWAAPPRTCCGAAPSSACA